MRTRPGWIFLAIFAMVLATVSPGIGYAVTALSATADHGVSAASATTTAFYSYNWAGYATNNSVGTVTKSSGTWTQPTVNCTKGGTTYVATWVGIDGFSSSDLVQTGTQAVCSGGVASYGAWWEVLPAPETTISTITVHAGDKIVGTVSYSTSTGKFSMKITDGTQSFTKTEKVTSAAKVRDSAECVIERPEVGSALSKLADFKTARFSSCTATISGVTAGIGTFAYVAQMDMVNNADTKYLATTGALGSTEKSFTTTWKGYGP